MADQGPWTKYQQPPAEEGPWTKYQQDAGSAWGDAARFAGTAAVRGLGALADFAVDPLSPLRRLISPDLERIEQSGKAQPGRAAGDAAFAVTGIPEYQPQTTGGRIGMAAAQGAVGGGPFGVGGALLGAASGALGQGTLEATDSERMGIAASLLPGLAVGLGSAGLGAARSKDPRVQALVDAGVTPTPGQIMGGAAGRFEEALKSIPALGDFIKTGRRRAVEQFNVGAVNKALEPIGEQFPKGATPGREVIGEAWDKVSDAYQQAVPQAGAPLTPKAISEFQNLAALSKNLPADHARRFEALMKRHVFDRVSKTGHLSGESFKQAESDLGKVATGYLRNRNSTYDDIQLGEALLEGQRILRDSLADANPAAATGVQSANEAFKRMLRVGNASGRPGEEPGVFSPAQLQAAVKKYGTDRQYQKGGALMQDYADAGRAVLGDRVPDSGTPYRSMAALLGGTALGGGVSLPTMATALAGVVPAWAMYSPRGQAAIAQALAGSPPPGLPLGLRALLSSGAAAEEFPLWGRF